MGVLEPIYLYATWPDAVYACINKKEACAPEETERNPFAWKRILEQFWKNCMIGKIVRETLRYPKRYAKILDNILYKNK